MFLIFLYFRFYVAPVTRLPILNIFRGSKNLWKILLSLLISIFGRIRVVVWMIKVLLLLNNRNVYLHIFRFLILNRHHSMQRQRITVQKRTEIPILRMSDSAHFVFEKYHQCVSFSTPFPLLYFMFLVSLCR